MASFALLLDVVAGYVRGLSGLAGHGGQEGLMVEHQTLHVAE